MGKEVAKSITADDSCLLLVDYQARMFYGVESHGRTEIKNSAMALAQGASILGIPTILTTITASFNGPFMPEIIAMFPGITVFDRETSTFNAFDEPEVREVVKATGRKQVAICGLWTSMCMCLTSLEGMRSGYDMFAVVDAAGSESLDGHNTAVMRMVQAGVVPCTWMQVVSEWMGSWKNPKSGDLYDRVYSRYSGYFGQKQSDK